MCPALGQSQAASALAETGTVTKTLLMDGSFRGWSKERGLRRGDAPFTSDRPEVEKSMKIYSFDSYFAKSEII